MAEQGDTNQERTERATPKRREEARKKGNVAKSTEVNSAAILLVGMLFFFFGGGYMLNAMKHYSIMIFENFGTIFLNPDNLPAYINLAVQSSAKIIFPFLGVMAVTGVLVNFAQIGPLLTAEPLTPKLSRINPITGFKRVLFSQKTLVELIKGILKISIICTIAFFSIKQDINDFVPLMDQSVAQMLAYVAAETFSLGLKIAAAMILLAVLDYMFQKYDYEKGIRMTKQEVKEELKQMEGDPHVKARIRSIQREMARRRMMDDVPDADVIITNPIKVAVALKYAPKEMESPKVLAMGKRKIAEKIRQIAIEHDIPIVEDKPLAWALIKSVNVGDFIPEDLFRSVAEILAYVYKLKNKKLA